MEEDGGTVLGVQVVIQGMEYQACFKVSDYSGFAEERENTMKIKVLAHNWDLLACPQEVNSLDILLGCLVLEQAVAGVVDEGNVAPEGALAFGFGEDDGVADGEHVVGIWDNIHVRGIMLDVEWF